MNYLLYNELNSYILPNTGGIGTTIFTIAGSVLVVAAVVVLIARYRMKNKK